MFGRRSRAERQRDRERQILEATTEYLLGAHHGDEQRSDDSLSKADPLEMQGPILWFGLTAIEELARERGTTVDAVIASLAPEAARRAGFSHPPSP